jgi:hypothetical protein
MYVPNEIIFLFFLISFLVYTMPMILVNFYKSLKGKILLILLTVVLTLYNQLGGLIMAMLIIFLEEFNYEFNNGILYEGFEEKDERADDDDDTDDDEDKPIKPFSDLLSMEEKLKQKSTTIPVQQTN